VDFDAAVVVNEAQFPKFVHGAWRFWFRQDCGRPSRERPGVDAMTVIRKHYNPPIPFEKYVPAVSRTEAKRGTTMTDYDYDTSRGPYHAILDKMARAHQAITGDSYAKSFTAVYTDPKNAAIRDGSKYDDLAKAFDSVHGTAHSLVKAAPAAPYDPLRKAADIAEQFGPAHAKLHSMAVDHQRAHSGMSYQQAYSHLYSRMENAPLREKIKAEHLRASMAAVQDRGELGKAAAPMDPKQDDVSPGSANYDLHQLVVARMKREPGLSYERAFTREYLHPDNRSLKDRVTAEGILHMQHLVPAYTAPGHRNAPSNLGRSGAKPAGYAGG
jgi:hypothetical protein